MTAHSVRYSPTQSRAVRVGIAAQYADRTAASIACSVEDKMRERWTTPLLVWQKTRTDLQS